MSEALELTKALQQSMNETLDKLEGLTDEHLGHALMGAPWATECGASWSTTSTMNACTWDRCTLSGSASRPCREIAWHG